MPLLKQAEKVLKITYLEAKLFKSNMIGTEHLLLGVIREGEGVAIGLLKKLGISFDFLTF